MLTALAGLLILALASRYAPVFDCPHKSGRRCMSDTYFNGVRVARLACFTCDDRGKVPLLVKLGMRR